VRLYYDIEDEGDRLDQLHSVEYESQRRYSSSVDIVTGYRLDYRGAGVCIAGEKEIFLRPLAFI
jgi:hypothetical protein